MAWTNEQKRVAVMACRAAGLSDEQRKMILASIDNARLHDGRVTSTAAKLNNADFESFMAIMELHTGGAVLHFSRGYWQDCARDSLGRMRHKALAIARELEAAGYLAGNGIGLRGWISKRVTRGETDQISELDYQGLRALIVGLEAYSRQRAALVPA